MNDPTNDPIRKAFQAQKAIETMKRKQAEFKSTVIVAIFGIIALVATVLLIYASGYPR